MSMFSKRTMAALFAIAITSSLIVATGLVGSAFAAIKDKSSSWIPKVQSQAPVVSKSHVANSSVV